MRIAGITQPTGRKTLDALVETLQFRELRSMDVATSYVTSGGLRIFSNWFKLNLGYVDFIFRRILSQLYAGFEENSPAARMLSKDELRGR